jgi:mono/diheme cytochrome c family protein
LDLAVDIKRLRWALLVSLVFLGIVFGTVAFSGLSPQWRVFQQEFNQEEEYRIRQIRNCNDGDNIDRCISCHLDFDNDHSSTPELKQPFRPHPEIPMKPQLADVGCSSCHGGVGRALTVEVAHSMLPGDKLDPLMKPPHIQASCARCHVPGAVAGTERLVEGSRLYLDLGCAVCHPLTPGGRGSFDFGPDLRSIGRKSLAYLEASIIDPTLNFAQSTMPSFAHTFEGQSEGLEDLLIYLESLVLIPPAKCDQSGQVNKLVNARCGSCHHGSPEEQKEMFSHRCVYIKDRKDELNCQNCHQGQHLKAGPNQGYCLFIGQHRSACSACH